MNVGVSGVGGAVGQSIMKALSISSLPTTVFAIDCLPLSAGLFRGDEGMLLPKPEEPGAMAEWELQLQEKEIAAVIPGSDYDLLPLALVRDDWEERDVCRLLVSDAELIRSCRDKAVTSQILESAGVPVPESVWNLTLNEAVTWARSQGYPVILKPRDGSASRNVHLVQDEEELRFFFPRTPNPVLQEHLNNSGSIEEFTCAVFVDNSGKPAGTFMAKRDLNSGTTYRAQVGVWPEIQEMLLAIGSALKPRGVLNVQLRMTERGPVPFELNNRCSGTTSIRAYFGYNEPEMLLRHYVLGEELSVPEVRTGYAIRYWNEMFLDGVTPENLETGPNGLKGKVIAWP